MDMKQEIKDSKLDVFTRLFAQIDALRNINQTPDVIYMSRELSDEFKSDARKYNNFHYISVDRDDNWDMAKFMGVSVRRVIDCTPSYLHVVGRGPKGIVV
jgi:hypothetical protein